ncbi:GTP cyclohydrolase family protein [Metarhizium robertsii]|uniref:GTP cyclohydrolase 1 n=1 Tax=Metarhizium robertsii TaxID=568076 RepID=A0A014MUG4_9HYPO|nr:GTP cyclohydrolase family protein [Metarhizium robertsii]
MKQDLLSDCHGGPIQEATPRHGQRVGLLKYQHQSYWQRTDIERDEAFPAEDASIVAAPLTNRHVNALEKRRNGLGKVARDRRDKPVAKGTKLPPGRRAPSPVFDIDGLSRPSRGTHNRIDEEPAQAEARSENMRGAVRTLLECLGEDPDREGLLATPSRYANALLFLTNGYKVNVKDIVNNALFYEGHNEMVIVKGIDIYSLSEMFSRRLQIQERLTRQVAHAIMEILNPQGVAVVMESCHMCMVMRGVEKTSTTTITSCVLGCFEKNNKTRNEFMSLVGVNKT